MRVSIPFIAGQWSLSRVDIVQRITEREVSIPFIAGQWSLTALVVAALAAAVVSIPFIAGQWSLCRPDRA